MSGGVHRGTLAGKWRTIRFKNRLKPGGRRKVVVRELLKERLQRAGEQRGDPIDDERHELRFVAVG